MQWFKACGEMLRAPQLDTAMLEKLSVVLQRVSKLWYAEIHTTYMTLCMVGGVGTMYSGWCWYNV